MSKEGTVPADKLQSRLTEGLLLKSFSLFCHRGLHLPHVGLKHRHQSEVQKQAVINQ